MDKRNEIKEIKVKMGKVNIAGTSRVGYLPEGVKYNEICEVFGEPQHLGLTSDSKTQAEWQGKVNELTFTIYDYKAGVEPQKNTDWHIGGKTELVAHLVNTYFKAMRAIHKRQR
jgi:hypothetical protein